MLRLNVTARVYGWHVPDVRRFVFLCGAAARYAKPPCLEDETLRLRWLQFVALCPLEREVRHCSLTSVAVGSYCQGVFVATDLFLQIVLPSLGGAKSKRGEKLVKPRLLATLDGRSLCVSRTLGETS